MKTVSTLPDLLLIRRLKAAFYRCASACTAEVQMQRISSIDSLKLNSNKVFHPMLHLFGLMSAHPHHRSNAV